MPAAFIRHELRSQPQAVRLIEVQGDSMEPTLKGGDRVLIDTNHRTPSPPGVYAVWDGFGLVVKRVQLVAMCDPLQVRLISDNPRHETATVSLADAHIVGRVILKISVM